MAHDHQSASDLRMWLFATLPACAILSAILQWQALGILLMLLGFATLECGRLADSRWSQAVARYAACCAIGVVISALLSLLVRGFGPPSELAIPDDAGLATMFWFDLRFQAAMVGVAAIVFAGCVAGRLSFSVQLALSGLLAAVIYPLFVSWTWGGGWLGQLGFHDFAGGTIVYAIAGWSGLGVAFASRNRPREQVATNRNTWLYALGGLLLWFSISGIGITGSHSNELLYVGMTTNIAAAGGMLSATLFSWFVFRGERLRFVFGGCFAGVAAITAGVGSLSQASSLLAGIGAGMLFVAFARGLERLSIPDDLGIIASFGAGGAWGTLCVGLFAARHALMPQVVGVLIAFVWAFGVFAIAGRLALKLSHRTDNGIAGTDKS